MSCQPVRGGPLDTPATVAGFALAALDGGAAGLRIEGVDDVRAVRAVTAAPVIGLVKRDLVDSPVRITPYLADVDALAEAGADIIAFDATRRPRPVPVPDLVAAIHAQGLPAMADCALEEDAIQALDAGADAVGTTLSGYLGGPEPDDPDFALIAALSRLTPKVIAEGRIRTPNQATAAMERGAYAVVVGSAITRPEHATAWFVTALQQSDVLSPRPVE